MIGTKKTLLIVDDDLSILKLLNFILSKDYEIVVKNNGVEAFGWLEDGNMPTANYIRLANAIF
jgi:two-component system chemotaxis response regulator CheY